MLNENWLGPALGQELPALSINDVHWKVEESTESSLLFYKLGETALSQQTFKERIASARFAWLIVNRADPSLPSNASVFPEEKWPELQKQLLDQLYPLPSIKLMAITGTNGKTTTAHLVLQLGELSGKRGLSIGTLGVREGHKTLLDFGLTSPAFIDLRKFLFRFGQNKDFCVMEASSHALAQYRLYGLEFDAAAWLSFSQDHLDYHHSMDDYFKAKSLLLDQLKEDAYIFVPREQTDLLARLGSKNKKVRATNGLSGELPLFFRTQFNKNNLEAAVALLEAVFKMEIPRIWDKLQPPEGRFYIRPFRSNFIVVDFAHTPDALENICKGIREAFPHHRLKVLFGCGGDRDPGKRPKMGKVADTWADEIYLTSDNPRSEDPDKIIDDITEGIRQKTFTRITDRAQAVEHAFYELKEKEVLLLAGKGHEDYVLIKGVKYPYSDIATIDGLIARNQA